MMLYFFRKVKACKFCAIDPVHHLETHMGCVGRAAPILSHHLIWICVVGFMHLFS